MGGSITGVYAKGYTHGQTGWADNKLAGLKDYMFTIVIENVVDDCWFTEKLMDSLLTGTIPIYWGCPSIGSLFDPAGIITFESVDQLASDIVPALNQSLYLRMLPAARRNFAAARRFLDPLHWMWEHELAPRTRPLQHSHNPHNLSSADPCTHSAHDPSPTPDLGHVLELSLGCSVCWDALEPSQKV